MGHSPPLWLENIGLTQIPKVSENGDHARLICGWMLASFWSAISEEAFSCGLVGFVG